MLTQTSLNENDHYSYNRFNTKLILREHPWIEGKILNKKCLNALVQRGDNSLLDYQPLVDNCNFLRDEKLLFVDEEGSLVFFKETCVRKEYFLFGQLKTYIKLYGVICRPIRWVVHQFPEESKRVRYILSFRSHFGMTILYKLPKDKYNEHGELVKGPESLYEWVQQIEARELAEIRNT